MKEHRLDDAAEILMGAAPPGDSYNRNQIGYPLIAGAADFGDEYPKAKKFTSKPTTLSSRGDIILCIRATIGDLNWSDGVYCLGRGVAGIRVRENVADRKYIFFCLKKQFEYLNRLGTGSTFRQIRRNNIENCPIPLPPLPVQKKIAAILDKADQARRKRQETLRLTDQFLQAAFLEMFGNPVTNPNGWEVRKFGDYVDLVTSGSRGWARYYADSGAKFIRVQNLTNHKLTLSDMAFVKPPDSSETERTRVQPNDVLISITGVVGLSAVVPQDIGEAYISQHVALARLKGNLNPMFASYFISNRLGGQLQFKKFQYGQTKPGLNLNQIRDLRIYVPSLAEQEKFAALVDRVEAFHERQRESEQELETLFQSLMQKAFK